MNRVRIIMMSGGISIMLTLGVLAASGQEKARRLDVGKMAVETPTKNLLAGSGNPTLRKAIDVAMAATAPKNDHAFVNAKVKPGLVTWHPSFEAACKASQRSNKPVLLFQLMGKLDDQFC